jgi:iron complex transport system substrate-binding protein
MKPFIRIEATSVCVAISLLFAIGGCDRTPAPAAPTTNPAAVAVTTHPTVASLVPAATSIIEGLGLSDHLIAVSTFDRTRGIGARLPSAGDYSTTDWELLGKLRPDKIIVQWAPDRIPPGFRDRATELGISMVDCWPLDRLSDEYARIADIAGALDQSAAGDAMCKLIHARMDALSDKSAGRPRVSVLLVVSDSDISVAGPGTFLDDIIHVAGGVNAVGPGELYRTVDPETLMSLKPDVVLILLPGAAPAVVDNAKANFARYKNMPAVVNHRVVAMTDPDLLIPGPRVADIAESIASILDQAAPTTRGDHP